MEQRFETDIQFECPKCGHFNSTSVAVPEPDWSVEKFSQLSSEGETEAQCGKCSTTFEAHVINDAGSCRVRFTDYPETRVNADIAFFSREDGDWSDYAPPDDPLAVYMDTYHDLQSLLKQQGRDTGSHVMNRMIFAQQISALEAFLADRLINRVMEDADARTRLLKFDQELVKTKYSLAEINAEPDLVSARVRTYLRTIVYHNLPRVSALYKAVFDIDLLAMLGEDKEKLFRAIEFRHDCVHRNGRDKGGKQLDVFTKEYLNDVNGLIQGFVEKLDMTILEVVGEIPL